MACVLTAWLVFGSLCSSYGRESTRKSDDDDSKASTLQLRDSVEGVGGGPRKLREEVFNERRRSPAWLSKLPQRLRKGDRGNRPFAVQDARVVGLSNTGLGFQAPVSTASTSKGAIEQAAPGGTKNPGALVPAPAALQPSAAPGSEAKWRMHAKTPNSEMAPPQGRGRVLAYDQEQLWRKRAREAWPRRRGGYIRRRAVRMKRLLVGLLFL